MHLSLKPLHDQVIVITGASSGIGLATARHAAKRGARVVLAARSGDSLAEVVREITGAGGEAIYVTADVGNRDEVQRIADAASERFGGFDTWVNNAAVSIWGRLEEVSDADSRRLFETNFWGMVYGSLVALKTLKTRGGALINLGSVVSDIGFPLQGMYAASKHAIKGFTDSLRMELKEAGAPVSVTLIKPGSIDTPLPSHARKYTAEQPHLPPPVYDPAEVATAILYAAVHPKRDIYVGSSARTLSLLGRSAPRLADRIGSTLLYSSQLRDEPARDHAGALHGAGGGARERGDQPGLVMKRSFYTRGSLHPLVTGAAVLTAGAIAYQLVNHRHRTESRDSGNQTLERELSNELSGIETAMRTPR